MARRLSIAALALIAIPVPAGEPKPLVAGVAAVGITVRDLDTSVAFYTGVLGFEKTFEVEVTGDAYEHLTGVFGARLRQYRKHLCQRRCRDNRANLGMAQRAAAEARST